MSRFPAFLAAVAFAAGVWLGSAAWRPPLWWMVALLACTGGAVLVVRSRRISYWLALLALVALGALDIGARDLRRSELVGVPTAVIGTPMVGNEEVQVTASVVRDSTSRARGNSTTEMVDVETECISTVEIAKEIETPGAGFSEPQPPSLRDDGPPIYATLRKPEKPRRVMKPDAPPLIGPCHPATVGLRITVYPHDTGEEDDGESAGVAAKFRYGERLRFIARLRPPRNFGNPAAWDYVGYLRDSDIDGLGSVRADRVETLSGFRGTRWGDVRARVRRSVLARIHTLWDNPRARLIAAMVVGDKSDLRRDIRTDFQRTGIFHVLVVSGMNVGIIAMVIFWVLRRLRIGDLTGSVLTVALSCGYALITDGGAPILRATLMLALYLGARLLYRERAALNTVGLSGLILLAADPRALFDASFQLTFIAVVAIAGIAAPLLERTTAPYRDASRHLDSVAYDMTLPPRSAQFRLDFRLLEKKAGRLVGKRVARFTMLGLLRAVLSATELFIVSAVAQFALALPMAVYFHRAVLVGLPANLVVVPLTGILMPAASAAVALAYGSPALAKPAAWITAWSLDAILWTVRVVGGWRASDWRIATPALWVALACAAAIAFCIFAVRKNRWLAAAGCAVLALSAAGVAGVPPRLQVPAGKLEFTAIDVGQSDSTLIVTPAQHTVLVDAAGSFGPFQSEFDFGEDVISPYLWSRGITRLDVVAITHGHSDHIGGMHSVIANFRPRELWLGPAAPDRALEELIEQARAAGAKIVVRSAPQEFSFGGAQFRVFSPPPDWGLKSRVRNEDSMVLRVSYGETSALITGDADKKMERLMLGAVPRATVLHVAHNGSSTSTSSEFLEAVRPEYAVISVGMRNQFRHPRQDVLDRLAIQHVRTYRTDLNGATTFLLDGAQVIPVLPGRH